MYKDPKSAKEYYLRNREKIIKYSIDWKKKNYGKVRNYRFNTRYGKTLIDYDKLLVAQNYRCAICNKNITEFKRGLAIDHDHKTGEVRGLLCFCCNMALGYFKDDTDLLNNAIKYLNKYFFLKQG